MKQLLQEKYGQIFTVHRLDRGTSGLIIFAKNETTHQHLSRQFEERTTEKIYYGILLGTLSNPKGDINAPISEHPVKKGLMTVHRKGKESLTEYEVMEDYGILSWVRFRIHTGRTHQVRVHAKYIGHPVACDDLYGDGKPIFLSTIKSKFKLGKNVEEERPLLDRLALHAFSLKFEDEKGNAQSLEATIPKDLRAVLQQLKKWKT